MFICLTMFGPSRLLGFLSGYMSAHFFLHPWKGVGGTRALAHLYVSWFRAASLRLSASRYGMNLHESGEA